MKRSTKMTILAICIAVTTVFGMAVTSMASTETIETQPASEESQTTERSASITEQPAESTSKKESRTDSKGTHGANVISVAADVLGMTKDEVKEAVKDGKVGDLLIAQDKVEAFKTAYLTETQTKLNEKVADGSLTQDEADEAYAKAEEKMASYDGTTHLCGREDHSGMFEQKSQESTSGSAA